MASLIRHYTFTGNNMERVLSLYFSDFEKSTNVITRRAIIQTIKNNIKMVDSIYHEEIISNLDERYQEIYREYIMN